MNEKSIAVSKDFVRGREPVKICFDLEISPLLSWVFGAYEATSKKIVKDYQIISVAHSVNDGPVQVKALCDFPGYKPGVSQLNDKHLVKYLYDVLSEADMVYGHNIKKFDMKHANARFIYHGLPPLKKLIVEDTLFIAKKYFKFPKNNLDYLTEQMGMGTKTSMRYDDLIWGCIDGEEKMWNLMKKYNRQDVVINQKLYKRLAPWHQTGFNANLFRRKPVCPNPACGSKNIGTNGEQPNKLNIKQRYRCRDCGKEWVGEIIARATRMEEVLRFTERVDQSNV